MSDSRSFVDDLEKRCNQPKSRRKRYSIGLAPIEIIPVDEYDDPDTHEIFLEIIEVLRDISTTLKGLDARVSKLEKQNRKSYPPLPDVF